MKSAWRMQGREKEWVSLWASLMFWTLEPGLGVWTGLTSRDHGPVGGTAVPRRTSTQQGPTASNVSVARTLEHLEPSHRWGARVLVSTGGALEGRWMWVSPSSTSPTPLHLL